MFSNEASKSTGHSSLLADKSEVYEVLVEDVAPGKWDDYLIHKGLIIISAGIRYTY
jgi:hypothetical protein